MGPLLLDMNELKKSLVAYKENAEPIVETIQDP
jgi:hypothetical protein